MKTLDEKLKQFEDSHYYIPLDIVPDFYPFFNKNDHNKFSVFRLYLHEDGFNYFIPLEGFDLIDDNLELTLDKQSQSAFLFSKLKERAKDSSDVDLYNVFSRNNNDIFSEISDLTNKKCKQITDNERDKINKFNDEIFESKKLRSIFESTYINSIFEYVDEFVGDFLDFFSFGQYSKFYQLDLDYQLIKTIAWDLIEQASEKCSEDLRKHKQTYEQRDSKIAEQLNEISTFYSNLNYNAHYAAQRNHYFYHDLLNEYSHKSNRIIERDFNEIKKDIKKKAELFI